MALPNQYQRTVTITPSSNTYTWDTPPSWITVDRVGSTDEWTITVAANTGASRSHSLTVRHDNTTTIDSILVSQVAGSGAPNPTAEPTATPVPTAQPTGTPVPTAQPTAIPTATPIPTVQPTPQPTSGSGSGSGPVATPIPTIQLTPFATLDSGIGSGTGGSGAIATPLPTVQPTATPVTSSGTGGGGGGCHLIGDLLTLANGETKAVENIVLGDALLSLNITGLGDDGVIFKQFDVATADYSDSYTNAIVSNITVDSYGSYYSINNGSLKLTHEHPVLIKTKDERAVFKNISNVIVGDSMLSQDNEWISVISNELINTGVQFTTYSFDVENKDVYFASQYLVHNVEQELSREDKGFDEGFNDQIQ